MSLICDITNHLKASSGPTFKCNVVTPCTSSEHTLRMEFTVKEKMSYVPQF